LQQIGTPEELETFLKESPSDLKVVGYMKPNSKEESVFTTFADKNRNTFQFGLATTFGLEGEAEKKGYRVLLYLPFAEAPLEYPGKLSVAKLKQWLLANKFPLIGQISQENYKDYMDRGLPLVWTFAPDDEDKQAPVVAKMKEVAAKYKDKVSVVYLSGEKYSGMAERLGLGAKSFPCVAVEDTKTKKHWAYPEDKPFESEPIAEFVGSVLAGTLAPTIKSEELPAKPQDESGVWVVVAKNFDEIVLDATKDVMIEFYAPWCGHCKSLAPIYAELAKSVAKSKNLRIAKMDASNNDVVAPGYDVSGFPTLYFKAAGAAKPTLYQGERTKEAILKFIKSKAKTEVVVE